MYPPFMHHVTSQGVSFTIPGNDFWLNLHTGEEKKEADSSTLLVLKLIVYFLQVSHESPVSSLPMC